MSVYSTQFFAGTLASSLATLYSVPAGHVVVVRDIELSNSSGGTVDSWVGIQHPGTLIPLINEPALASAAVAQWTGRVVINPGDAIVSFSTGANTGCVVSGYLFAQ